MTPSATHPFYPLGFSKTRTVAGSLALPAASSPTGTAALTRRLAAGEESAFREFHAQYFDRLYRFLLIVARGQEQEAREALQETLLHVARRARGFEDDDAFWCWLKAVARNAARDAGRRRSRYFALLRDFALDHSAPPSSTPALDDTRLSTLLEETLTELASSDSQLLRAKYLHGATVRELAAATSSTEKAVESRLLRLRRELRARVLKKLASP